MRRNDHDVTDRIRTTDLKQVSAEVLRLYRGLYNGDARPTRSSAPSTTWAACTAASIPITCPATPSTTTSSTCWT